MENFSRDSVMAELEAKMDAMLSKLANVDSVLGKVDSRVASMDGRLAGFDARLVKLQDEVSGIRADFTSQKEEISKVRMDVSAVQADLGANSSKLTEHESELEAMRAKLADMEDRGRRCNGRKLRFSPDYSAHTVKRRLAFSTVMDQARAKGIEFFLIYPATLRIKSKSGVWEACRSPRAAEDFITSLLRGSQGVEGGG
ncbi:unnamed protein product, partial [Pleuronectes platessa]